MRPTVEYWVFYINFSQEKVSGEILCERVSAAMLVTGHCFNCPQEKRVVRFCVKSFRQSDGCYVDWKRWMMTVCFCVGWFELFSTLCCFVFVARTSCTSV